MSKYFKRRRSMNTGATEQKEKQPTHFFAGRNSDPTSFFSGTGDKASPDAAPAEEEKSADGFSFDAAMTEEKNADSAPKEEDKSADAAPAAEEEKSADAAPAEEEKSADNASFDAAPAEEEKSADAAPAEEEKSADKASFDAAKEEEKSADAAPAEEEKSADAAPAEEEKSADTASFDAAKEEEKSADAAPARSQSARTVKKRLNMDQARTRLVDRGNGDVMMSQSIPFEQEIKGGSQQEEPVTRYIPYVSGAGDYESSYDTVSAAIGYSPSVTNSGTVGSGDFGTTGSSASMSGITITSTGTTHSVTGTLNLSIWWQVRSSKGPSGQINITGENDTNITEDNYLSVAADLKPNSSGRAPRSSFWSKSFTERHEQYHAYTQRKESFGPQRVTAISNWIAGQTVSSATDLNSAFFQQALSEGSRVFNALVSLPSTEGDAYADGKSSYQTLSSAIKTKGDAGGY